MPAGAIEEELRYPVTTGTTDHPGGYVGALADFYDECDARVTAHLEAGRDVVLLAEGDPLFYGSSMYLVDRLKDRFATEVVPGIPAFAAATAGLAQPLVRQTDVLTVLAGTLPEPELARRLADTDGAIIMKLGRTFPAVRSALAQAGRLEGAMYVERASMPEERWQPVAEVDPDSVPYFSLIVVPGDSARTQRRLERPRSMSLHELSPSASVDEVAPPSRLPSSSWSGSVPARTAGSPPKRPTPWRASTTWSATRRTSTGSPSAPDSSGTRRATPSRWTGPGSRSTWRCAASGSRWCPAATPASSAWRRPSTRRRRTSSTPTCRSGWSQVSVRSRPSPPAPGAPIGADFAVVSLSDRLKPWPVIERRLRAIAEADLVLGIYNPASRSRRDQVVAAQKLLLEHRSPDTVVVVGRDVGRAEESLEVTTLAELDADTVDMKCLLLVGASSTRVTAGGAVWTPRWVE